LTKMRRSRGWLNHQAAARSSQSLTSAACITTTNVAPPDRRSRCHLIWPVRSVVRLFCPLTPTSVVYGSRRTSVRGSGVRFCDLDNTPSAILMMQMQFPVGTATEWRTATLSASIRSATESTKDAGQPRSKVGMPGAGFTTWRRGQARSDTPALKPYRGKPAVRILGGTMETSASFEARSAPSSYPTRGDAMAVLPQGAQAAARPPMPPPEIRNERLRN
jgi:hypothetical protein